MNPRLPQPSRSDEPETGVSPKKGRNTLPPPEWSGPATVSSKSKAPTSGEPRSWGIAEEWSLRARLRTATLRGNQVEERATSLNLAHWLASRERDLDEAIALLRRALVLQEEGELRRELSAWLESLGDASGSARVLEEALQAHGLEPSERAYLLTRVGVLHARSGNADAADKAFQAAALLSEEAVAKVNDPGNGVDRTLGLLRRSLVIGTAEELSTALATAMSQAVPLEPLAEVYAKVLSRLATVDAPKASVLARRMLDVFGAAHPAIERVLREVAVVTNDLSFCGTVLERAIAADPTPERRTQLFQQLADFCKDQNDSDGEARAIARTMRAGGDAGEWRTRLNAMEGRWLNADGELYWLEAMVAALRKVGEVSAGCATERDFGEALWVAARDQDGATDAWFRAAKIGKHGAFALLSADLLRHAGPEFALERLRNWMATEVDNVTYAGLATEAARVLLSTGNAADALDLVTTALIRHAGYTEAIAIAERAAVAAGDEGGLSTLYDAVGSSALGRFGRRAAHYRAARFFEQRGSAELALKHAAQAFRAVPSEGAAFILLARTADAACGWPQAMRAVEGVAEQVSNAALRASWLLRAAEIAGKGEDGARRRIQVLFTACQLAPTAPTLARLSEAVRELVEIVPEEKDVLEMRIVRAAQATVPKLDGPEGGRVAIDFILIILQLAEDSTPALPLLEKALACDGDLDDYTRLIPLAHRLSGAPAARAALERILVAAEKPYASVGVPATKLIDAISRGVGDEGLRRRARLLAAKLEDDSLTPEELAARWGQVADERETEGDLAGAIEALREAAKHEPESMVRWSALERVAELAGDDDARIAALNEIASRIGPAGRGAVMKRLARVFEEREDVAAAETAWRSAHEAEPGDADADRALEEIFIVQNRFADLAELLAERAQRLSRSPDHREQLRALRLRRAAILEQRLGRVQDACDELALLLKDWPSHASALRYTADLYEKMGRFADAAPLWMQVASLERDPETRVDLELRAAQALYASGDRGAAQSNLRAIIARIAGYVPALTLQAEWARENNNFKELGDALEQLAITSTNGPSEQGALLLEAAHASARAGEMHLSLDRAQRAAVLTPSRAGAQLLARGLEYKLRGVGAPDDARRTLEELARIEGNLSDEDAALRVFLRAEAIDAVQGRGAGMRELMGADDRTTAQPLVALGVAERLNSQGSFNAAIPLFEKALSGDFLGLRRKGAVALAGAEAAIRAGLPTTARRLLEQAALEPETRSQAVARLAQLAPSADNGDRPTPVSPERLSPKPPFSVR